MSSVVMTKTFGKMLTNDQHFSQTSAQLSQREKNQIIERLIAIMSENKLKTWFDIGLKEEYQRRHNHRLPDDWLLILNECGQNVIEVETLSLSNCTKTLIKLPIRKKEVKKEPLAATPPPALTTPKLPIPEPMNVSLSSNSVEPKVDNKSDELLVDIKPSEANSVPNKTVDRRHDINGSSDQTKSASINTVANNGVNNCLDSSNEAVKDVIYGGKPIAPPILPPVKPMPINPEDFFDVVVLLAATPYNFIVVPFKNSDKTSDFFEMKYKMCEWYEKEENTIEVPPELFRKGLFVAAKAYNVWYRVEIISVLSEDPFQVIGYLCDYGEHKTFSLENIQPLYNCFRDLPMQAIRASLATVEPIGSDWDVITSVEFRKMVENKPFVATVYGIKEVDQNPVLLLSLCDTSGADDVYIGPHLIQRNLAKPLVTSI